jgi:hypothetical protein
MKIYVHTLHGNITTDVKKKKGGADRASHDLLPNRTPGKPQLKPTEAKNIEPQNFGTDMRASILPR